MRGSPFTFSNFALGLNVYDSPYTLKQGESRDCLNVVSTPRGAIKKRFGSTIFASGAAAYFPTLAATDTFERANEKPLSNAGKWTGFATLTTGEILSNHWVPTGLNSAAYWNVAEQTNPAVSVELFEDITLSNRFAVVACLDATTTKWYEANAKLTNVAKEENSVAVIKENAGTPTTLLTIENVVFKSKDRLGITVRAGQVTAWRYINAETRWVSLGSVADSSYTKGFSGIKGHNEGGTAPALNNFSTGEAPAPPAEEEFTSLLPCKIGATNYLVAASDGKLFSVTEKGEITEIGKGFTTGKKWAIVQAAEGGRVAKGPVYLTNGTDPPQSWTGAAKNTEVTEWTSKPEGEFIAVPKAKYMVYHGNRVWASGVGEAGKESAVYWSGFQTVETIETADPTNWPKANVNYYEKDDGNPITALGSVNNYVLVFKQHRTWVIFDLNQGENRQISDTIGCVSNRSVVETHMGTFFLTPDQGVYLTNGSTMKDVSRNIRPILQGIDPFESRAADVTKLENAAGAYLNASYFLTYVAKDGSTKTLEYNTVLNSWWLHDLGGNQWVTWEVKSEPSLYTIPKGTKKGIVKAFVKEVFQDSGVNYTGGRELSAFWCSSWEPFWQYFMRHRFQQPQVKKRIRTLFLDGKGELKAFSFKGFEKAKEELKGVVDNNDMASPESPVKLGNYPGNSASEREYQAARFYSLGASRIWSFCFGNASGEQFEVDTYACDLNFRKA